MRKDKYTHEYNSKIIKSLPDEINTYMPLSAGVESTAAFIYAINDPEIYPFCVTWYDPELGDMAEAMLLYVEKMCNFYDVPLVTYSSGVIPTDEIVPIIISGLSAWMSTVVGMERFNWKWFMGSGNSEDDIRMRNQFKEYRRILSQHYSDSLDGHGFSMKAILKTPEVRYPFEYMSKSELIAFIMQTEPEIYKYLWTCGTPKAALKDKGEITGYLPCGKCKKCIEFIGAETRALEAVHRVATGITYLEKFNQGFKR